MKGFGRQVRDAAYEDTVLDVDLAPERAESSDAEESRDDPTVTGAHSPTVARVVSGTQLRHRLITPEALAASNEDAPRPGLLGRILKFRRR